LLWAATLSFRSAHQNLLARNWALKTLILTGTEFGEHATPAAGLFGFYAATFRHDGTDLRIINVHLTPFGARRDSTFTEVMGAISKTEEKHVAEVADIMNVVNADCRRLQ